MKGRPPIPAKLKLLHGNPGKRDIQDEPEPPKGVPSMPGGLGEHGERAWSEAASLLDEMGMLTLAEGPLLFLYSQAMQGYYEAQQSVAKLGLVLTQKKKTGEIEVRRNPFSVELHKYRESAHKLLVELGLTPIARARLGVGAQKAESEISQFLA